MNLRHRILFTIVVTVLGGWLAIAFAPASASPSPTPSPITNHNENIMSISEQG